MKTFEKNIEDRKVLKQRLEELLGKNADYSGLPRCAFLFDGFTIEKDGTLYVEDDADEEVLSTLISEGLIKEESSDDPEDEEENILKPRIAFGTDKHTGRSLRNLTFLLYGQANLISKATGGSFDVDEGFVKRLDLDTTLETTEAFLDALRQYEENHGPVFTGVEITEEEINFTGFPEQGDPIKTQAFKDLAKGINETAIRYKRTIAKKANESNEKYYFRMFMVRCGLDGKEYGDTRKSLMENLSGHCAFKTSVEEERWKKRQQIKREALKAAKAAAKAEESKVEAEEADDDDEEEQED